MVVSYLPMLYTECITVLNLNLYTVYMNVTDIQYTCIYLVEIITVCVI